MNFYPAGSTEDRVAKQIIEDYEKEGRIQKGGTIIEGTSETYGLVCLMAANRGYQATFVMLDNLEEKRQALRACIKVVIPTDVAPEDLEIPLSRIRAICSRRRIAVVPINITIPESQGAPSKHRLNFGNKLMEISIFLLRVLVQVAPFERENIHDKRKMKIRGSTQRLIVP